MDRGTWQATIHGAAESDTTKHTHAHLTFYLRDLSIHRFWYWRKVLDLIPCGYQGIAVLMPSPATEHFSRHLWNGARHQQFSKTPNAPPTQDDSNMQFGLIITLGDIILPE